MQQHDRPGEEARGESRAKLGIGLRLPVPRIVGPEHNREPGVASRAQVRPLQRSKRRSVVEDGRPAQALQHPPGARQPLCQTRDANRIETFVAIPVQRDLVPGRHDGLNQGGMSGRALRNEEERAPGAEIGERLENRRGARRMRSIVECERDPALARPAPPEDPGAAGKRDPANGGMGRLV